MPASGVRRLAMSKKAAAGHKRGGVGSGFGGAMQTTPAVGKGPYKCPTTESTSETPVGRKDKATGYMAGKRRAKTRGTGAATSGTRHTSFT